jgi:hypothetical protein
MNEFPGDFNGNQNSHIIQTQLAKYRKIIYDSFKSATYGSDLRINLGSDPIESDVLYKLVQEIIDRNFECYDIWEGDDIIVVIIGNNA